MTQRLTKETVGQISPKTREEARAFLKRCPHASDHDLTCTNSNDPGQPGSVYQ